MNYLASPLQLALIIPFVRVGEHLLGVPPQPLSISEGFRLMGEGVLHSIVVLLGRDRARGARLDRDRPLHHLRACIACSRPFLVRAAQLRRPPAR